MVHLAKNSVPFSTRIDTKVEELPQLKGIGLHFGPLTRDSRGSIIVLLICKTPKRKLAKLVKAFSGEAALLVRRSPAKMNLGSKEVPGATKGL